MEIRKPGPVGGNARKVLGAVALLTFLGLYVVGFQTADAAGWIPHTRDTMVYVGARDWMENEYRDCVALPEKDGSVFFLGCVNGPMMEAAPPTLPVTYWGKIKRPDMFKTVLSDPGINSWKWRCRRKKDSMTCWAVN